MGNIIKGILIYGSIIAVTGYIPTFVILTVLALKGQLGSDTFNQILIPYGLLVFGFVSGLMATAWFDEWRK